MKISIQSSTLVKPYSPPPSTTTDSSYSSSAAAAANPSSHGSNSSVIWNSNIDLVIPRIHTPSVYFFRNHEASPDFFSCDLLKQSLARALVPFYPMAGRLKVVEKEKEKEGAPGGAGGAGGVRKRRVDIDCNGQGVLFVEAMADGCISEYGEQLFTPSMEMRRLIPHIHYDADHSYPLLIIQVTFFKCGGVSLGVGVQHHVADGMAALSFLNYWGQVCRASVSEARKGRGSVMMTMTNAASAPASAAAAASMPPPPSIFFDRTLLKARDPPNPIFEHVEYQTPPPLLLQKEEEEEKEKHRHTNGSLLRRPAMAMATATDGSPLQEAYWKEREELLLLPAPLQEKEIRSDVHGDGDGDGDGSEGGDEIASDLFVFTKEQLEELKRKVSLRDKKHERQQLDPTKAAAARANGHGQDSRSRSRSSRDGDGDGEEEWVALTSYEVLSAHVWRCVSLARSLRPDQVSKLYIATDGRRRLRPPLPEGYFGNSIFTATPMRTVHDLVERPLAETGHAIRSTLRGMTDEYLRSAIDYLELQPDVTSLARGAHTFRTPNLGITSWVRLPIYETEFGWGPPAWMGPAGVPFEGLAYLLPPPPQSHPSLSMLLSITLSPHHMARFRQLIHNFDRY